MNQFAAYERPYYPEHPESGARGGFVVAAKPGDVSDI